MLRAGPLPTACGVGSINQLFGVLAALREPASRSRREVSVVSFDEDECLAFLEVPVTSVCMPLAELGAAAVDALIARIEGGAIGGGAIGSGAIGGGAATGGPRQTCWSASHVPGAARLGGAASRPRQKAGPMTPPAGHTAPVGKTVLAASP